MFFGLMGMVCPAGAVFGGAPIAPVSLVGAVFGGAPIAPVSLWYLVGAVFAGAPIAPVSLLYSFKKGPESSDEEG